MLFLCPVFYDRDDMVQPLARIQNITEAVPTVKSPLIIAPPDHTRLRQYGFHRRAFCSVVPSALNYSAAWRK